MKRIGNLFEKVISLDNLRLADKKARKGKSKQYGVKLFDKDPEANLLALHEKLKNKTWKTSAYKTFQIKDPKPREIFCLPYIDRIVHHAIMNILEPIFVATFTADSYSCIKGKGIHAGVRAIKKAMRDQEATKNCLQIDITKFYPNVDHDILKMQLRRKIKDKDLLNLLDGIIDSAPGLPIGNYLSQYFANFNLTYFDHWLKEQKGVQDYIRYADDIAIFGRTKQELHKLLWEITWYLEENLKLQVKGNYQIFPIAKNDTSPGRPLNMLGYLFYHEQTKVRPEIKKSCFRKISKKGNKKFYSAYKGWFDHADCINLKNKINEQIQSI